MKLFTVCTFLVVALALIAAPLDAQNCPCVPIAQTWTVKACPTWNCAVSEMVLADGSAKIMTLPTNSADHKWVVLRLVPSGSYTESPDTPFTIESFDSVATATARFSGMDTELQPLMVTTPDARTLVVALRQRAEQTAPVPARRRATGP